MFFPLKHSRWRVAKTTFIFHLWVYVIELHPNCQSNTFSSVQFIWSCATEEDHNACITWTKQLTFFFINLYGITACSINDCFSKISMLTLKEECSSSGLKGKSQVLPNKTPSLLNRTEYSLKKGAPLDVQWLKCSLKTPKSLRHMVLTWANTCMAFKMVKTAW